MGAYARTIAAPDHSRRKGVLRVSLQLQKLAELSLHLAEEPS